jgi:hypothetical protein
MGKRVRMSVGAVLASAVLVLGSATAASADWAGPYSSLKYCQKARAAVIANGYYSVGQCQPAAGAWIFYYERV